MDPKIQLNDLISVQSMIIVDCYKILNDLTYLSDTNHPKEIAEIIEGDRFFIRSGNYMWIIITLELNKLFDKRENYTILKSLNVAINNQKKISWQRKFPLDLLNQLKKRIESDSIQTTITNLAYIRDKQIAHLDKDRFDKDILVRITEARVLVDISQEVLSELNLALNGAQLGLNYDFIGICQGTIANLAAYNKVRFQ